MIRLRDGCPCTRECPRRDETCHGACEDYAQWRTKREAAKAEYFKRSEGTYNADVYLIERNAKYKRMIDDAKKRLRKRESKK